MRSRNEFNIYSVLEIIDVLNLIKLKDSNNCDLTNAILFIIYIY